MGVERGLDRLTRMGLEPPETGPGMGQWLDLARARELGMVRHLEQERGRALGTGEERERELGMELPMVGGSKINNGRTVIIGRLLDGNEWEAGYGERRTLSPRSSSRLECRMKKDLITIFGDLVALMSFGIGMR